jgi:DNA primase
MRSAEYVEQNMKIEDKSRSQENKENFDIKSYLDSVEIKWSDAGENVTAGWINIPCPFCSDHKNHCGINLKTKHFHCWLCRETGDAIKLIREIERCSYSQSRERILFFQEQWVQVEDESWKKTKKQRAKEDSDLLPLGYESMYNTAIPDIVQRYFSSRDFPLSLIEKYKLGYCKYGKFNTRVIIPVYNNREMVSYQAMDVTRKAEIKYIDCHPDIAKIPNKKNIYGYDDMMSRVKNQVILVEGVTDKWRVGKYAVALFGKNYTVDQYLLLAKVLKRDTVIKVLFDPDATDQGYQFAKLLSANFDSVYFINLEGKRDPAELTEKEIKEIINI